MKFKRTFGYILVFLGIGGAMLAALATVVPMLAKENEQIQLILTSMWEPSRDPLTSILNSAFLWMITSNYVLLAASAVLMLVGFALLLTNRGQELPSFTPTPVSTPPPYEVKPEAYQQVTAPPPPATGAPAPLPTGPLLPSDTDAAADEANPYKTYGHSIYAPPEADVYRRPETGDSAPNQKEALPPEENPAPEAPVPPVPSPVPPAPHPKEMPSTPEPASPTPPSSANLTAQPIPKVGKTFVPPPEILFHQEAPLEAPPAKRPRIRFSGFSAQAPGPTPPESMDQAPAEPPAEAPAPATRIRSTMRKKSSGPME